MQCVSEYPALKLQKHSNFVPRLIHFSIFFFLINHSNYGHFVHYSAHGSNNGPLNDWTPANDRVPDQSIIQIYEWKGYHWFVQSSIIKLVVGNWKRKHFQLLNTSPKLVDNCTCGTIPFLVTIWILDKSGIWMIQTYPVVEWSGCQMVVWKIGQKCLFHGLKCPIFIWTT